MKLRTGWCRVRDLELFDVAAFVLVGAIGLLFPGIARAGVLLLSGSAIIYFISKGRQEWRRERIENIRKRLTRARELKV